MPKSLNATLVDEDGTTLVISKETSNRFYITVANDERATIQLDNNGIRELILALKAKLKE